MCHLKVPHTVPKDPDDHGIMCTHDFNFGMEEDGCFLLSKNFFEY